MYIWLHCIVSNLSKMLRQKNVDVAPPGKFSANALSPAVPPHFLILESPLVSLLAATGSTACFLQTIC